MCPSKFKSSKFKPSKRSPLSDDEVERFTFKRKKFSSDKDDNIEKSDLKINEEIIGSNIIKNSEKLNLHSKIDTNYMDNTAKINDNDNTDNTENIIETKDENLKDENFSDESDEDELIKKNFIPPEVLYRLKNFSLFNDAPNSFFIALARSLRLVQYRPQEYIVKFGEPAKSMYWILRGTVGVTSTDTEAIYAELAPGSFFGEIGIMFNRPRTATVIARTKVLLGILTKDALTIVLSDFPKIERIIRDEGQERLSMQEKRKRLLRMTLPTISKKVSIVPPPFPFRNSIVTPTINNNSGQEFLNVEFQNQNIYSNNNNNNNITNINNIIQHNNQNNFIHSSLVANHHDQVPGPSLPPVSTFFNSPLKNSSNLSNEFVDSIPMSSKQNSNLKSLKNVLDDNNIKLDDFNNNNNNNNNNNSGIDLKRKSAFASVDNIDNSISIREFLYSLHIFAMLPSNIMHELALDVEVVRYRPMEYIFKKGEFGREIFFIVYGEVEVINKVKVLARLGPMMYFGEFAFLSTLNDNILKPRSADIRTITDCEVLMIKASTLDSICEKYPLISEEFKRTAFERTQKNVDYNGSDNYKESESKLVKEDDNDNGIFKKVNFANKAITPCDSFDLDPIISDDHITKSSKQFDSSNENFVNSDVPFQRSNSLNSPLNGSDNSSSPMFKTFSFGSASVSPTFNNNSDNIKNNFNKPSMMLTMPPLNPVHGSIQNFSSFQKTNFQYAPLAFRRRLSGINKGRRRSSVLNIGPLPDSIILRIFEILDLKSLVKCSMVCLRWKQLIYLSSALFNRLDLTPWCKEIDDNIIIKITQLVGSRPKFIDISNCYHITDEGFSYMINEIGIRGNIQELIMKNNWNISAMAIMDLSVACRSIIKLDLSNCRKVKDDVMVRLIGFKNDYKFGCHLLQDLKLGYCKYLTDYTMHHISNNANDRLVSLDLTRCTTITDNGFSNWYDTTFFHLKKLILKDCTFLSDQVIEKISSSCPRIEILDLTFCCMLTDYSLKLLGNGCKNLSTLNLSFCGAAVSDYSLNDLKHLTKLSHLSIKGCVRVTREGVDMLLTKVENLKELNLLQCPRVNLFQGVQVDPFDKAAGCNYSCLKIKPHGRIVRVLV